MLVGQARTFFMDNISTGLDSSTTFEIVEFLKQLVHLMDLTMVVSLLQPSHETFELFDDLILLCDGRIIYQGCRDKVLDFFESMGFRCPERKNIADFLQQVISKMDQAQYWANDHSSYQYVPVKKFVKSFHSFHLGRLMQDELGWPYKQEGSEPSIQLKGNGSVPKWEIFKACFFREWLLMKRNSAVHIFKTVQILVLALVVMTLFAGRSKQNLTILDANIYMGSIFSGVMVVMFNGMIELTMAVMRLPIFFKQRELLFLPGWAVLSSIFLLNLPMSFLEAGIWTSLTYFFIGFAPSAIRFFQQFLAYFCIHQMSMSLFRFLAIIGRTQVMANTLATGIFITVSIVGGLIGSKDNIKPWWVWGYWTSPMTYALNAVAVNEFLDKRWSMKIYDENGRGDTVGKAFLEMRGMFTEGSWFWMSVGALLCMSLFFNIFSILGLEYLNAPKKNQATLSIHSDDTKQTRKVDIEAARGATPESGVVLPFQHLTLAFSHINYYVDKPAETKKCGITEESLQLLRDVSGTFRPGVLTALMGVTGAGKTTLLDVLAGRKTGGHTEGSISLSGYPKRQETFTRISGYCEQNDVHSPFLTVHESLRYASWLRLPSDVKAETRNMFVDEVMDLVELRPLKNAMVGLPGINGLSTGQRKRLTIAVELVSSPSIIFMDEPTTGLDAQAAAIVMRAVRNTADTGRTIVCTIHQPSTEIFQAFDELLLMKRGGCLIYGGPLGPFSQNMIQYFETLSGIPKIKDGQNPAVWMLDVTSSVMELKLGIDFADIFQNSYLYIKNMELVDELSKAKTNSRDLHFPSKYAQSFRVQFVACLQKLHWSYWKNPEHNVIRFFLTVIISLLFGTVFYGIGRKKTREQDISNILGVLYGSTLFLAFANAALLQPVVGLERIVFYRERSAGMYSSMPFAIAQVAIEIPYVIIQVLLFCFIVYPMVGFQWEIAKFSWFIFFILLGFIYFALLGMMTVALTPNAEIAATLSFFLYVMWSIFSGFFIPRPMIQIYWRWFYWANPVAWTIYGLLASQLGDDIELLHIPGQLLHQSVKEFIKIYLGVTSNHFPLIVALHVGIIVLFLFVFGLSIKYLNFQRR